jgi:phage gpG-like protein
LTIRGEIVRGRDLPQQFKAAQGRVISKVDATVAALTTKLTAMVKRKLGGEVLKVRTGTLRRSINQRITKTDASIYGTVGVGMNAPYGRVHELGGTFKVPEHLRMQTMAFGKPMMQPRRVRVRAHTVTYKQRSFLQASLDQMTPEILRALPDAVIEGLKG